jgi:hypothetical protein
MKFEFNPDLLWISSKFLRKIYSESFFPRKFKLFFDFFFSIPDPFINPKCVLHFHQSEKRNMWSIWFDQIEKDIPMCTL